MHSQGSTRIETQTGGNPLLTPEKAISRTAGFEYSPHWISDLSFGADYYEIDLSNEIATSGVPAQYILNECYDKSSPTYCNLITLSGGSITNIEDIEQNIGGESTSGVDLDANYALPENWLGQFDVATNWTIVRSFIEDLPSATSSSGLVSIQELEYAVVEIPKVRGTVNLSWGRADWSAAWNITYIGKIFENCSALTIANAECSQPTTIYSPTGSAGEHELNTTIYNDASVSYDIEPIRANLTLGIQNIFNKGYPLAYTAGAPPNFEGEMGYRVTGRFLYARIGVKF